MTRASRHWRNQRATSIALLPLGLWFLLSLLGQPSLDHAIVAGWFAKPLQALLGALFGAALLWHSMQGVQVVIEDYVGGPLRAFSIAVAADSSRNAFSATLRCSLSLRAIKSRAIAIAVSV